MWLWEMFASSLGTSFVYQSNCFIPLGTLHGKEVKPYNTEPRSQCYVMVYDWQRTKRAR
jgi:hypothetical protein